MYTLEVTTSDKIRDFKFRTEDAMLKMRDDLTRYFNAQEWTYSFKLNYPKKHKS